MSEKKLMSEKRAPHLIAVLQALLVTVLWSTSWVLIKIGLEDLPALTFAGLRYCLAFLVLLPLALRPANVASLRQLSRKGWMRLIALGILFYAVTQGAQFLGLTYLPAITVTLLLSFTSVVVALLGIVLLNERPTALQWFGVLLNLVGVVVYFYPIDIPLNQAVGLLLVLLGVIANSFSSVLGRRINRDGDIPPIAVTTVSMGIGAVILLVTGISAQGLPRLSPTNWLIIGWLALVNTAFAFSLWNHTLRTLSAMESTIINNTMLIQIAILAWVFLGERVNWQEGIGLAMAGIGAMIAQIRRD
jgi:drug/metabolite transporter (DMT)-like permease